MNGNIYTNSGFGFENELKFDNERNMPLTREEMKRAIDAKWVHPAFRDGKITVDKLLDFVDVVLDWYVPSVHAMDFMNFIRMSLGEEPENNNPKAHYFLLDCIFQQPEVKPFFDVRGIDYDALKGRTAILSTREFSKSTLIGSYLVLYMAAKGELPGFGKVDYGLYVSDSMRNNVKTTMETIGAVYRGSEYLRGIFEEAVTNQDGIKFVRKPTSAKDISLYNEYVVRRKMKESEVPRRMKRTFAMDGLGAASGGRGSRNELSRPVFAIFDDLIGNEVDARSEIILENIDSTIESDVLPALSGNGNFTLLIGTPYNKKDPVYSRIEGGSWLPVVFPKAEVMNEYIDKASFRGVWPDRHTYENCRKDYMAAKRSYDNGKTSPMKKLMQEYYLRIATDGDRMIQDDYISWYSRNDLMKYSWNYNWYITTDLTTTHADGSNLAAIFLWAVDSESRFFLVDMRLAIMGIEEQDDTVFAMVRNLEGKTRGVEVGIELDGNQDTRIDLLREKMPKKNIFFQFARQRGTKVGGKVGIRSRLEGGNKHWRFRMMLPYFQNQKIWFPKELRSTSDMSELLEELKMTTYTNFGAKYDDGNDAISQLSMIQISYPAPGENYQPQEDKVGIKHTGTNIAIWGKNAFKDYDDDNNGAYSSYV